MYRRPVAPPTGMCLQPANDVGDEAYDRGSTEHLRFTAERFERLAGGKRGATTGLNRPCDCTLKWVPEMGYLSSLQDELH